MLLLRRKTVLLRTGFKILLLTFDLTSTLTRHGLVQAVTYRFHALIMSTDQLLNVFLGNPSRNGKVDRRLHKKLDRFLAPLITASYYPKSQLILSSGQSADYLYFVEEGLARGFCFEPGKKNEITVYF